jgi:hypothetical protein
MTLLYGGIEAPRDMKGCSGTLELRQGFAKEQACIIILVAFTRMRAQDIQTGHRDKSDDSRGTRWQLVQPLFQVFPFVRNREPKIRYMEK